MASMMAMKKKLIMWTMITIIMLMLLMMLMLMMLVMMMMMMIRSPAIVAMDAGASRSIAVAGRRSFAMAAAAGSRARRGEDDRQVLVRVAGKSGVLEMLLQSLAPLHNPMQGMQSKNRSRSHRMQSKNSTSIRSIECRARIDLNPIECKARIDLNPEMD
jgi:hypothetical protein